MNEFRKSDWCWICGNKRAVEMHHCIVHDSKKMHDKVTIPENLMPVCHECHTVARRGLGYNERMAFAIRRMAQGYDVIGWYKSLGLKKPEHWILNLCTGKARKNEH